MASTINADNGVSSGSAGLKSTADSSGVLALQTNGTTAISIDASQAVSFTNQPTYSGGTANGVAYLNGSKVLTTGSALVFDGTNLRVGTTSNLSVADKLTVVGGNFAVQRTSGITTFMGDNTVDGYAGTATNQAFTLLTNSVERLRLNTSGTVILQGGSTSATGVGITFPATQSASTDANTLDDYEEGTFTPTLVSGSLSYVFQVGKYVKVGRLVSYVISLNATRTSSSSAFQVGGLPFTSDGTGYLYVASCVFPIIGFNRSTATSYIGQVAPGSTTITIYGVITSSTANYLPVLMSDTGSSIEVEIAGTYLAA